MLLYFNLLPLPFSPLDPLQVLLMQESVRRIVEGEESKMGEETYTHRLSRYTRVRTENLLLVRC